MSEEDFIHSIISPFRASFYISHSHSHDHSRDASLLAGPPDVTNLNHFETQKTFLIDRRGGLASHFASADSLAKASLSLSFLAPFTSQQNSRHALDMIIHPSILGSFSLLSSKPTYKDLLSHNQRIHGGAYSAETLKQALMRTLEYFVQLNYLTLWIESEPANGRDQGQGMRQMGGNQEPGTGTGKKTSSSSLQDRLRTVGSPDGATATAAAASPTASTSSQVHDSGLTFRKRSKTEEGNARTSRASPAPTLPHLQQVDQQQQQEMASTAGAVDEQDSSDSIPPICRIPGMSVGSFCESYQQKKMKLASASASPPPASPSPLSGRGQEEVKKMAPQSASPEADEVDEVTRIENLKKMGFTDVIIKKILAKNEGKKTTAAKDKTFEGGGTSGRPAICSLPGVHAGGLCKAYESKGGKERAASPPPPPGWSSFHHFPHSVPLPSPPSSAERQRMKRSIAVPEYSPQTKLELLATFRNPNCHQL
jgi:hypothetical protein